MQSGDLLLVVDMQKVYCKGGKWECLNTEGAAANILKIIETQKIDAIFTRFIANEENPFGVWKNYNIKYEQVNHNPKANEMMDCFIPALKKFPLYTKGVYSSLVIPQVKEKCLKAKRVILTGVVAECCVLSTALHLMDEGVYTVYLTDGVSGLDRPKELATELIFSGLSPLHIKMMSTQEYLEEKPL